MFSSLQLIFLDPTTCYYWKGSWWQPIPCEWASACARLSRWDLTASVKCQAWHDCTRAVTVSIRVLFIEWLAIIANIWIFEQFLLLSSANWGPIHPDYWCNYPFIAIICNYSYYLFAKSFTIICNYCTK